MAKVKKKLTVAQTCARKAAKAERQNEVYVGFNEWKSGQSQKITHDRKNGW